MIRLIAITAIATLFAFSAAAQQTDPFHAFFRALARSSPGGAARYDYEQSVAEYKKCLAANPAKPALCEPQRHIMDNDAQVLSGYSHDAPAVNPYLQQLQPPPPPPMMRTTTCVPMGNAVSCTQF